MEFGEKVDRFLAELFEKRLPASPALKESLDAIPDHDFLYAHTLTLDVAHRHMDRYGESAYALFKIADCNAELNDPNKYDRKD